MQNIINKTSIVLTLLLLFSIVTLGLINTKQVVAQSASDAVCETVGGTSTGGGCSDSGTDLGASSISDLLATLLNVLSIIAGVAAVIMVMIAGFKYITSGGDSGSVTSAKNTLLYAIVGIVIVAMSQIIVRFVLARTT